MPPLDRLSARLLRIYGWVFLVSGAAFVLCPGPLTDALNLFSRALPGASALAGREPSLWLGLAGSMMAMIAYLQSRRK